MDMKNRWSNFGKRLDARVAELELPVELLAGAVLLAVILRWLSA